MSFPDPAVAPRIEPRRRDKLDRPGATARNNPFNPTGKARVAPDHDKT
ncbi:MAG: hypothetical protein OXG99_15925 [Alphaproteobacteria bacterium]|nr:hypothetical protein [Alphaproteobacteria bacterium]